MRGSRILCFLRFTLAQSNPNVPYKWLVRTLPNLLYVHEQEFPSLLVLSFSTSSSFSNSVNIQFSPNLNPSETTSKHTRRTGEAEGEYDTSQEEDRGWVESCSFNFETTFFIYLTYNLLETSSEYFETISVKRNC